MKAWFFGLQPRERWIIAVGAAVALAIVLWGFVVSPLRAEVARLRTSVDTKQRLLIDVARIEGGQPSQVVGNRQGTDQPLYLIISNTAGAYGVEPRNTRANGPSGVDVSVQNASADALLTWLVALHGTYGIDVETASFSPAREPGLVNGQLSLRRL
jgi:general secretion pathway protein M